MAKELGVPVIMLSQLNRYLQLVNPPAGKNYNGNRAVEVSEMSRGL